MVIDTKQKLVEEQLPQAGGSYIRNEDGSLVKNEADQQKEMPVENPAAQTLKE